MPVFGLLIAASIASSRPTDDDTAAEQSFQSDTDPVSGQPTSTGQAEPEKQDIPGAPTFYGLTVLLDHGMMSGTVQQVKEALSLYTVDHPDLGIATISLDQDVTAETSEDGGTVVYTVGIVYNAQSDQPTERLLNVTVHLLELSQVTISEVDGTGVVEVET